MADPDLGQHILSGFNAMNTIANASEMEKERRAKFIADQAMQQVQQEAQQEYIKGQQQEREFGAQMQPFKMQGQQLALKQIQMQLDLAPLETFTTIIEKFGWNPDEGYKMVDTFFPGYGEKMRKVWLESQVRKGQAAQSLNAVAPPTGPSQGEPGTPQPQPPPATQPQGQQPAQGQQPVAQGPSPAELIQQRLQAARTPQTPQRILPDLLGSASQAAGVPPVNAAQYLNPIGQMLTGTVQQQAQGIAQQAMQEAQPPAEAAVTPEMAAQVPPAAPAPAPSSIPSVVPQVAQALGAIAAPYSKLPTTMQEAEAMAPLLMTPKQLQEAQDRAIAKAKADSEEATRKARRASMLGEILKRNKDNSVGLTFSDFVQWDEEAARDWRAGVKDYLIRSGKVKVADEQGRPLDPIVVETAVDNFELSPKYANDAEKLQQAKDKEARIAKFAELSLRLKSDQFADRKSLAWKQFELKKDDLAIRHQMAADRLNLARDKNARERYVSRVKGGSIAAIEGRYQSQAAQLDKMVNQAVLDETEAIATQKYLADAAQRGEKIAGSGGMMVDPKDMLATAALNVSRAQAKRAKASELAQATRTELNLLRAAAGARVQGGVIQQQVGANGGPDKGRVPGQAGTKTRTPAQLAAIRAHMAAMQRKFGTQ